MKPGAKIVKRQGAGCVEPWRRVGGGFGGASRWRYKVYVPDVREGGVEAYELIVGRRISTCTRPYSMV